MKFKMNLAFCVLVVVLTRVSQTRGQDTASPLVFTLSATTSPSWSSSSPELTDYPGNDDLPRAHTPRVGGETSATTTTMTNTEGHSETAANTVFTTGVLTASPALTTLQHSTVPVVVTVKPGTLSPSAAADSQPPPHVTTTEEPEALLTTAGPLAAFSSQPTDTVQDMSSTATAAFSSSSPSSSSSSSSSSTSFTTTVQPQSSESPAPSTAQPTTTPLPVTSAIVRGPVGPTHVEVPSELNVGDEDLKGPHSSSPLDPLLAGLLSVFIVTTAVVFVVLFLKFRQRTNHPEFHRLQDLPMDDLMEDTPLSRYSY